MEINKISKEYTELEKQIERVQKQLRKMPKETLILSKNGKYFHCFKTDGKNKEYIKKENHQYLSQLAYKKYLTYLLENLQNKQESIRKYLKQYNSKPDKLMPLLTNPYFIELIEPYFRPTSQELAIWQSKSFKSNPYHPEELKHPSITSHMFRSKSEATIDSALFRHQIPNHYEEILVIANQEIYPDFTIRHPRTGAIYYYEHFGRMDDPQYVKKTLWKLNLYYTHDFIPGVNFLATYETKDHPFSEIQIEQIIEQYFT